VKPAAFRYHRPASLDAALALLAEHGDAAKPIAGGQSLVPMMNLRLAQPAELVDLGDLHALRTIRFDGDAIEVGAMVRHHELETDERVLERCPLLAEAAATIGHYAIRQRGTVGGSLAHADPAAQWPLVAATLGATIEVASACGRRSLPAASFFVAVMTTGLAPDELIVAVRFPAAARGEGAAYRAFARRTGDFAIASAAVALELDGGAVRRLRLGVGGVGATPVVLDAIAAAQAGRRADAAWDAAVAAAARDAVRIEDVPRVPADYRRELVGTMVARALEAARARAGARR
jgi:carbon-monoxide dehydrogenase medium subunit